MNKYAVVVGAGNGGLSAAIKADVKFGYIHPCCTYPLTDMALDIPPIDGEVDV